MTAPDWKDTTDWSDLPEVYLTKVQRHPGNLWRIEACSISIDHRPAVPLVRRDPAVLADLPEVQALVGREVAKALVGAALRLTRGINGLGRNISTDKGETKHES